MNSVWINNNKNNKKLTVFFNGWGFDETAVKHLNCEDYNVLSVQDYRNFEFDFSLFNFDKYEKKYLVCWSMGVYVSDIFSEYFKNFNKKIAINGTQKMIDDEFGIPTRVYSLTLRHFNETSREKFVQNMFNGKEQHSISPKRNLEELKQELQSLNELNVYASLNFDKVYISTQDKIVPAKNQLNYWLNKTSTELLNAPHYPFFEFKNWKDIL